MVAQWYVTLAYLNINYGTFPLIWREHMHNDINKGLVFARF